MFNKVKLLGYINWVYILIICFLTLSVWRYVFNSTSIFLCINVVLIFLLFLYMCFFIISY
jgi:hypothetical protein